MHLPIKYEKKVSDRGHVVYVAFVKKPRIAYDGRRFKATTAVRISKEGGGYRVDFASAVGGTFVPWEPIDEVSHRSVASAKKVVRAFVEAEPKED